MFAFNQLQSDKYKVPHEGSAKGPDSQIEVEIAREIVHVEPEEEGNGQRLSENAIHVSTVAQKKQIKGKKDRRRRKRATRPLYMASNLPHTAISRKIESRINKFLEDKSTEERVTIRSFAREVHNSDSSLTDRFRVIIAFQTREGADIAFFIMYIIEHMYTDGRYATAHIDYIDSVKFFEPSRVRTDVYQEIILGYLDHARSICFTDVWLYSCAPEGKEYVFNRRPNHQVEINQERLNLWYEAIFEEGENRGIVYDVTNSLTDKSDKTQKMNIEMKLRQSNELDVDPREDETLRCEIVELSNLINFFAACDEELYTFSTVSNAHYTTQALLFQMFQDLSTPDDSQCTLDDVD